MILHTGVDGGLHDLVFLQVVSYGCLAVNAIAYWTRKAIKHIKREK